MIAGGITELARGAPEGTIFGLKDSRGIGAQCGTLAELGIDVKDFPGGRREGKNFTIAAGAMKFGEPEISVAAEDKTIGRAAAGKGVEEREELQIGSVGLNFEEAHAIGSVDEIEAVEIAVGAEDGNIPEGERRRGQGERDGDGGGGERDAFRDADGIERNLQLHGAGGGFEQPDAVCDGESFDCD